MAVRAVRLCMAVSVLSLVVALGSAQAHRAPRAQMVLPKAPDLVVEEMSILWAGWDVPELQVTVRVRNRGQAAAVPSEVMVAYTQDILSANPLIVRHQATGTIPSGGFEDVVLKLPGMLRGMLVAVADVPVTGHAQGQVAEHAIVLQASAAPGADLNNALVVIFTGKTENMPIRIVNPDLK